MATETAAKKQKTDEEDKEMPKMTSSFWFDEEITEDLSPPAPESQSNAFRRRCLDARRAELQWSCPVTNEPSRSHFDRNVDRLGPCACA